MLWLELLWKTALQLNFMFHSPIVSWGYFRSWPKYTLLVRVFSRAVTLFFFFWYMGMLWLELWSFLQITLTHGFRLKVGSFDSTNFEFKIFYKLNKLAHSIHFLVLFLNFLFKRNNKNMIYFFVHAELESHLLF